MKKERFLLIYGILALSCIFAQDKKAINLEELWLKNTFHSVNNIYFNPLPKGDYYSELQYDEEGIYSYIVKYRYDNGRPTDTIIKTKDLRLHFKDNPSPIEGYQVSPDESKVLFYVNQESIYRHSTREDYYVWNRATQSLSKVYNGKEKQMYGLFSPDGKKVSYVVNNNIFIRDLSSGKETQVTFDGAINEVINGAADWVYEEEFAFNIAYFWSPDGSRIAYYRFDESNVKEYSFPEYGTLYPEEYRYKYPKAGENNSVVSIHIYEIASGKTISVGINGEADQYIPRVQWTKDPELLSLLRLNRKQNKAELFIFNTKNGKSKLIYTEESPTYVDIHEGKGDYCYFLNNKKEFILMSEKDGYNHLYLYSLKGKLVNQITKGAWDVESFKGVDGDGTVFYVSAEESPLNRALYSVNLNGKGKKKLTPQSGTHRVEFTPSLKYYIDVFSDANSPSLISLFTSKGELVRTLEDNKEFKETLLNYSISKKEFFSFKTNEGIKLNGWMIKPVDFNPAKKYPVFMTIYGGPGSNTVNNAWDARNLWYQLLAQKGYIVASVDNRGTGMRGREFKNCTYLQLGKLETLDQIEAAKYMGSLPYVDKTRIGIFGWSYGGYLSSLCLLKGAAYFKAAIAVAPVTNWRYYDSIYTERFMRTPQENGKNYDDNSPINYVSNLKGKYLLVHGTSDDNVHFQNTVEMTEALIKAGKQFDLFFYPNKNHSLGGARIGYHLYSKMTDFIVKNL